MTELHEVLAERVSGWRTAGYPHQTYPTIAEILQYMRHEDGTSRYLREPQIRALETYWYLRLVERTPRIEDLYLRTFEGTAVLDALGLTGDAYLRAAVDAGGAAGLLDRIRTDDEFAREHRLEGLRETLTLAYPSYILALAMGAGKTILIGAIVATEFAMAIEYPDATDPFVENALVFAPGRTIIESLRELSRIRYQDLLPPRLCTPFETSRKVTFTRDGDKDIPVTRGSRFNLVVTNTEKIAIRAKPVRKNAGFLQLKALEEEATAEANLRLQTLASLPHLGVFSDEAHHTYGQALDTELKRVRQTVNYLADATNVVAVVNTTGTPYFRRQPLRDVVVWYGLSEGIRDDILKDVADSIYDYAFDDDSTDEFVAEIVRDFFTAYGDHALPDGSPARLAIYFPQTDDLAALRPHFELAVSQAGLDASTILANTSLSSAAEVDAFNRLNDPASPHRVILLVNKGTEGWNCPSLFATALARRLRTSNNFVLQAATRCLRQVPGNTKAARIYLSSANRSILDSQLRETYGESLAQFGGTARERVTRIIRIRKTDLPPMTVRQPRTVSRRSSDAALGLLAFTRPQPAPAEGLVRTIFDVGLAGASRRILSQVGDAVALEVGEDTVSAYAAAQQLAAAYRADPWTILDALRATYPDAPVPVAHLPGLALQIEQSFGGYVTDETVDERALAVLDPDGFEEGPDGGRQATIGYPKDRDHLVYGRERIGEEAGPYGFHYEPYNFDSSPESDFFLRIIRAVGEAPTSVRDVYYTGAITDPRRTDLSFSYTGRDGRLHRYTPDFVINTTDDRWLLVEVKMAAREHDEVEGRDGLKSRALRRLEAENLGRIAYHMVFADGDTVRHQDFAAVRGVATHTV
ncbi:MAG: DEAD/DEAH box helicase family protein [Chloroflexi bacterium]|nr:DEAD/DEAH box helicase family protein [Chloroflexota bacterium]